MIEQQLIDSAKYIRKRFLNLTGQLNGYTEDVRSLSDFLQEKMKSLEEYSKTTVKKIKSREDVGKVTNHLLSEIISIEDEEKKLHKKVDNINKEIESLRKEEEFLYKTIKQRHPNLNDEQIVKEVQRHLEK